MRIVLAACLSFLAFALIGVSPAHAQQALTPQEEARVRALVRETLLQNPEIIEEAFAELQEKRLRALRSKIETDRRHYAIGPANAPITVVEFFDYRCGYCKQAADWLFDLSRRRDVRIIFKEYPVLGEDSVEAARAAVATMRQGGDRYLKLHRAMMNHRGPLDAAAIDRLARESGVDVRRMRTDMRAPEIQTLLEDNHETAAQANVQGTPAFMINGAFLYGFDRAALDKMVREAGAKKKG